MTTSEDVLDYWFGDADPIKASSARWDVWFGGSPQVDQRIRERFRGAISQAALGDLDHWKDTARGRLAWVILLDQFTRNAYRDTVRMYAFDALALHAAREGVRLGHDRELPAVWASFLYLPFEHAEELAAQQDSLAHFGRLVAEATPELRQTLQGNLDYAKRHEVVVRRFGRFPHRNVLYGRASTEAELAFLATDAAPF